MSRVSDILIDIQDHLDTGRSDADIAKIVGCPVSWVTQEREEHERLTDGIFDDEPEFF
jgi:uncharacterized metal-binding protein